MNFKHKLGAASVLAAAWYSGAAMATEYSTEIYSVTVDADNGTLLIDGVDLAPAGAPAGAHVQLLGQSLVIHEANSSNTHLEAALPESVSLNPGTGYQLYVSPDRPRSVLSTSPADQAFFTVYVSSKVEGAKAGSVAAGGHSGTAIGSTAAGGAKSSSTNNLFNSLGSAFSLNNHSTTNTAGGGGVTTSNGSTFTLPYSGSASSTGPLFALTNTGTGDALDGVNSSTAANAYGIRGLISSVSSGSGSAGLRGINEGTGSTGYGVWGTQNGGGIGVYGLAPSTGQGVRGRSSGSGTGVYADSVSGKGLFAISSTGVPATFEVNNTSSTADAVDVINAATGRGLNVTSLYTSNTADAVDISVAGTGRGLNVSNTNTSSAASTLQVSTAGTGSAATFSSSNGSNSVNVTNLGSGIGISGSSTGNTGIYASTGTVSGAGVLADNLNGGEAATGRTASVSGTPTGAVVGRNDGPGYGVSGFIATDTSGTGIGVLGRVGISGSTGIAGHFENLNASNAGNALEAVTNGTGSAASFSNTNSSNSSNTLYVTSNGPGVIADHTQGNAANFFINNTSGVGAGVRGQTNSIFGNNGTAGVYGSASGTGGYGGYFDHTNSSGFGLALYATTAGLGVTAHIENTNASNAQNVLEAVTNGTGTSASITNTNNANSANTLYVTSNGPGVIADHTQGNAGEFFMNNTNGVGAGVRGEVNSIFGNNGTAGVYGSASGTGGYGGYFDHTNASGFGIALFATTAGLGVTEHVENTNASNAQSVLEATTNGTGITANFTNTNNQNSSNTLYVTTTGPGVIADHSQGNAGSFFNNNTQGVGAGVRGEVNSIFGNNGTAGVYGVSSGTGGYAGYFDHTNSSGFGISVETVNHGQGPVLVVDHEGSSGDLADFQVAGSNVARIDRTGRGFFDGGTQNSGADLAEFVPTTGALPQVGDVVEIDPEHPNTFRLCSQASTTRVAGIISTAPGVTLNAKHGAMQDVSGPALALAGRVPTKVNNQGGAIHIGDLLVASAEPGRAMRAPEHPEPGTVIGKALQNSQDPEDTVEVLVMLR